MTANPRQFRLPMPDGVLTRDTFILPPQQPPTIKRGCMLIVRERTGDLLTVHDSRLFPADAHRVPMLTATRRACLKCGRVQGIVEDQVRCPDHSGMCGLLEPPQKDDRGPTRIGLPSDSGKLPAS